MFGQFFGNKFFWFFSLERTEVYLMTSNGSQSRQRAIELIFNKKDETYPVNCSPLFLNLTILFVNLFDSNYLSNNTLRCSMKFNDTKFDSRNNISTRRYS